MASITKLLARVAATPAPATMQVRIDRPAPDDMVDEQVQRFAVFTASPPASGRMTVVVHAFITRERSASVPRLVAGSRLRACDSRSPCFFTSVRAAHLSRKRAHAGLVHGPQHDS
jgi:hypothetical protein